MASDYLSEAEVKGILDGICAERGKSGVAIDSAFDGE